VSGTPKQQTRILADCGEYCRVAGAVAPERKLNGAAAKKIEPKFSAVCLLLFAIAFNVR
jgi:hypothetical protein